MIESVERRSIENRFETFVLQIVQSLDFTKVGRLPNDGKDGDEQTDKRLQQNVRW